MFFPQLIGLVGGTMGLLTGFSMLSAVEILYFGFKFLRRNRALKKARNALLTCFLACFACFKKPYQNLLCKKV